MVVPRGTPRGAGYHGQRPSLPSELGCQLAEQPVSTVLVFPADQEHLAGTQIVSPGGPFVPDADGTVQPGWFQVTSSPMRSADDAQLARSVSQCPSSVMVSVLRRGSVLVLVTSEGIRDPRATVCRWWLRGPRVVFADSHDVLLAGLRNGALVAENDEEVLLPVTLGVVDGAAVVAVGDEQQAVVRWGFFPGRAGRCERLAAPDAVQVGVLQRVLLPTVSVFWSAVRRTSAAYSSAPCPAGSPRRRTSRHTPARSAAGRSTPRTRRAAAQPPDAPSCRSGRRLCPTPVGHTAADPGI